MLRHTCVYIHCWRWASVAFYFHIGKLLMLQFKLRFHIHDNINSLLITGLIMRGKISNVFRAFGSSLFGSAARIMFWNSAGTWARVWKIDATRGRGQRCGRIARETASAVTRCCSNLARLVDPIKVESTTSGSNVNVYHYSYLNQIGFQLLVRHLNEKQRYPLCSQCLIKVLFY